MPMAQPTSRDIAALRRRISTPPMNPHFRSAIIHHFAIKSSVFMLLGASRLKRAALVLLSLVLASMGFMSCGHYSSSNQPPSRISTRVLISQDVNSSFTFGGLKIINAQNDTVPAVAEIPAG